MADVSLKDIVTDAVRYWEVRRVLYNVVLAGIAVAVVLAGWPESARTVMASPGDTLLTVFVLAVLANIAYCAAYPVDITLQYSDFRPHWLRYRWLLFGLGLIFASSLTLWFALLLTQPYANAA